MSIDRGLSVRITNMSLICSLMVVMIHVLKRDLGLTGLAARFQSYFGDGVCRIAVPFFFLVAGYFIAAHLKEDHYWRNEVCKRIKSLIVPFVFWSIVSGCICSIIMLLTGRGDEILRCGRVLQVLGINPFAFPELRQLWFVRVLFIYVLMLPIFKLISSSAFGVTCIFVVYLICKPFGSHFFDRDMLIFVNYGGFSVEGAAYFSLGMFLRKKNIYMLQLNTLTGVVVLLTGIALKFVICHVPYISESALFFSVPVMLYGLFSLIPERQIGWTFHHDSFKVYIVHLIFIFIYFSLLESCCWGDMAVWFDPGRSLVGSMVCFGIVVSCVAGLIAVLKPLSKKSKMCDLLFWGGR